MELIDAILTITKCESPEQLKNLAPKRKKWLARSIEQRVPSDLATIEEWNNLLMYLMDAPPEKENSVAKNKILCYLRGGEYTDGFEKKGCLPLGK